MSGYKVETYFEVKYFPWDEAQGAMAAVLLSEMYNCDSQFTALQMFRHQIKNSDKHSITEVKEKIILTKLEPCVVQLKLDIKRLKLKYAWGKRKKKLC